jgi:glycosyltransferase involved in cell wall biosynthesis
MEGPRVIVNQWVPAAHAGDAVGDHVRALAGLLRAWGHDSAIYAIDIDDELADEVRPWDDVRSRAGDATILHFATASPMTEAFGRVPGVRLLHYHNITPPAFFAAFDTTLAALTSHARRELRTLSDRIDVAFAPSEYSRQELEALGFRRTAILPLALDLDRLRLAARVPALERLLADGLANILFVGRLAPNKKIEDHLRLAEQYRRYIDLDARFIFVGRADAVPPYFAAIWRLLGRHRLAADRVWFTGAVPPAELAAYYRHAHAYVSLSEHEGFGVPLVEAMAMDVPIVAYAAAAVPETLGGAGLAFAPKDLEFAAELLGEVVYDQPLRDGVVAGQRQRVRHFDGPQVEARLQAALSAAGVPGPPARGAQRA